MGYKAALDKAYGELSATRAAGRLSVRFFSDEYSADLEKRTLKNTKDGRIADDYIAVLILHYAVRKMDGLPPLTGKWISFRALDGGEVYYPAFRKRAIEPVIKKYGANPEGLLSNMERLGAEKGSAGDYSIKLNPFDNVPALVSIFGQNEEFPASANFLFDESIKRIFATEDVAVLAGLVASKL
ncbi:MAG: DUF3786 domain-containing protein [bacterium]